METLKQQSFAISGVAVWVLSAMIFMLLTAALVVMTLLMVELKQSFHRRHYRYGFLRALSGPRNGT